MRQVRSNLYVPFESGQLSTSSDVYEHEIPGGQYTNLLYQSRQLGLSPIVCVIHVHERGRSVHEPSLPVSSTGPLRQMARD